ncbi:hypothetical protein H4R33_005537 [Dimargaris cristalligena]|uniref:Cytidyltransferase-like domain-containing protein n=1 Tax=Dimargaris cristalligena TaxID=215637 RepID=A0A4P9ZWD0_9FUNG|nr:hypothetical protein H4R33_005537 [Dimargaris cristalligena]RKP37927.1 hypothetical protein BJ085DRAFT_32841 [Dimargaris cristalligena]|eukprot:RKP37927.1 hypothetical protein BJ085DRAFT_32841 [Dimargaris cristalligena]
MGTTTTNPMATAQHSILLLRLPNSVHSDPSLVQQVLTEVILKTARSLLIILDCPGLSRQASPRDTTHPIGWSQLQNLLALLYATATQVAAKQNKFLFETDIILERPTEPQSCVRLANISQICVARNASEPSGQDTGLFSITAMGGTFDHLHSGHKLLLTMAAWITTGTLYCAVSDEPLLKNKKFADYLEPFPKRCRRVRDFLNLINPDLDYRTPPLEDPYGPTITAPEIQALICSEETLPGGHAVNNERAKRNFPPLQLMVITVISHASPKANLSDNRSSETQSAYSLKLSSTAIREYYHKLDCSS